MPGYRGASWNPVVGCSRKSSGCEHCYAEVMASRIANSALAKLRKKMGLDKGEDTFGVTYMQQAILDELTPTEGAYIKAVKWQRGGDEPADWWDVAKPQWSRKLIPLPHALEIPLKKKAPTAWFVNSMSDLFHEDVPFEFIDQVFAVMALCPQHLFLILTKRPDRMAEYCTGGSAGQAREFAYAKPEPVLQTWDSSFKQDPLVQGVPFATVRLPLPNVWLGTSVEDQKTADERIPHLLRVPAAVRFLSCEPLLGAVNLRHTYMIGGGAAVSVNPLTGQRNNGNGMRMLMGGPSAYPRIDWVIAGGESGPKARPFVLGHAKDIVRQCQAAGVPVFMKQLGAKPVNREGVAHPTTSKKGGDMSEWPEELQVQEWPRVIAGIGETPDGRDKRAGARPASGVTARKSRAVKSENA